MTVRTDRPASSVEWVVRLGFSSIFLLSASLSGAQDGKELLISHVKELAAANDDTKRDSIGALVKRELRSLLEAPGGISMPMDDVPLSRIDAPDGRFRLVTWNVPRADGSYHYEGFLLSKRGRKTSLIELNDRTSSITSPELAELSSERWYGALYYQVIPVKGGGRTWYTLLGWKGFSSSETHKVIEVLSFRGDKVRFGAALFGGGKIKEQRKIHAFAMQSTMVLRYEPDQERIVMDHLSPTRADMAGKPAFMGPDMSFDGLVWEKGQWNYQRDIDLRDPSRGRPFNAPPPEPRP